MAYNAPLLFEVNPMLLKTCYVTGAGAIPAKQAARVQEALAREARMAAAAGYARYIFDFTAGIELYYADAVAALQGESSAVCVTAAIPYGNLLLRMRRNARMRALLNGCSEIIVLDERYTPDAYIRHGIYWVKQAERVIAVDNGRASSGAAVAIRTALTMRRELHEIFISG